jgi:hypothetical protein
MPSLIVILFIWIWCLTGMLTWILRIVEFKGAFHRSEMKRDSILNACLYGPLLFFIND